ncbi:hypothetical protein XA68_18576 [Ophiocordyceps unilateralis]|uniref:feruloyl esterase n=1 Tax=Ophiocordyceps unilateralis TaxID=268505 RepID=A0A2A9P0B9_OPHUN|nr:hypothetical protein XA68_18576 [Ophiocordyceps unilateralis]
MARHPHRLLFLLVALTVSVAATAHLAASLGCGHDHDFAGSSRNFSIQSGGRTRQYRLHLPSAYDKYKPAPLLLAFHGAGDNPVNFEQKTHFSDEHVNRGMIIVYPAGFKKHWEGPKYATPGVDDKTFISDLIGHLLDSYCVDVSRIYATGHSNGGGFVNSLACSPDHGRYFAAVAPVSGAFYTDDTACRPHRLPLPVMEIHGTADRTIPYTGGEGRGGTLPSIAEWLERWARRDGCNTLPVEVGLSSSRVHVLRWTNCHGRDDVLRHVRLDGATHKWPGKDSAFDASPAIVEFLLAHRKV